MSFSLAQRKELKETSTPSKSPPIWGDLTENHGRPMIFRVMVWLAEPVPYGRAIFFYIPAVAAPSCVPSVASGKAERERGSTPQNVEREKRRVGKGLSPRQDGFIWFSLLELDYLIWVKNVAVIAHNLEKMLVGEEKRVYLCSVKRH